MWYGGEVAARMVMLGSSGFALAGYAAGVFRWLVVTLESTEKVCM